MQRSKYKFSHDSTELIVTIDGFWQTNSCLGGSFSLLAVWVMIYEGFCVREWEVMSEYSVLVENGERLEHWKKKNHLFWREKKIIFKWDRKINNMHWCLETWKAAHKSTLCVLTLNLLAIYFGLCCLCWVRREANCLLHVLAKFALSIFLFVAMKIFSLPPLWLDLAKWYLQCFVYLAKK